MTRVAQQTLKVVSHRPWDLPPGYWRYYQEWNNALFLHWKVPIDVLKPLIPTKLELDLHEGNSWVSIVAFKMEKIRPRGFPSLSVISDFHEINVRTYVTRNNKPGVYFLNIEAQKVISVLIARNLSGLPYEKSIITVANSDESIKFKSTNSSKGFKLEADFNVGRLISDKTSLDLWLTERYCLYLKEDDSLFRYEIHHCEWEVKTVDIRKLEIYYKIGDLVIDSSMPEIVHYSPGVKVLAWRRKAC